MKYDRELLYIASLLHDLGLSASHAADKRFEVDGADAATRFLLANDCPKAKAEIVWDAIALHALADIADRKQSEVALVHFGAHVDVMGLRMEEITPSLIDDTLALYPRIGMKAAFTEALAEVARKKPHTAIGTGLADIGRRLVHGLEIPNVCDIIHAAPFES
ncbi:HD domain-containing protein [Bradyrhizobium sp. AZCC 2230]|uniref:HD domain-containing protein n=1 Tax=Bradyrhizobium sp. AZCC 2230 TaxID=3117021 RepID=UPI003FA587C8